MIDIRQGDCLAIMPTLEAGSADLILCDPPFGTTACEWDTVIPLEPLWEQYRRLLKPRGAVVLFASQPFTSHLVISNQEWFKYANVWKKTRLTNFQNAKNRPMLNHEDILVFSPGTTANRSTRRMTYNPQGLKRYDKRIDGTKTSRRDSDGHKFIRACHKPEMIQEFTGYPGTVLEFASEGDTIHPTQKPLDLIEYLVRTYSNPGDLVLDNTMGSGTAGVACINTERRFIGIELDPECFELARKRLDDARNAWPLFDTLPTVERTLLFASLTPEAIP